MDEAAPALAAAAEALEEGLLVVLPTETVYGLACRPDASAATDRLFRAKQRPLGLNLPVLADSAEEAWGVGLADPTARALAEAFWPGPFTLVLPRTHRSRRWHLGEATDTVAVRVPDHAVCAELLVRTGPLAATSANLSGRPPLADPHAIEETFGEAVAVYLMISSAEPALAASASTVVDLTDGSLRILREGRISLDAIDRVVGRA